MSRVRMCGRCSRKDRRGLHSVPTGGICQGPGLPTGRCRMDAFESTVSSRRVFLRNTTSGISDPICYENYHTFALGRDQKFHVCSNFHCEIVFLRNTRPDEIMAQIGKSRPYSGLGFTLNVHVSLVTRTLRPAVNHHHETARALTLVGMLTLRVCQILAAC